MNPDDFVIVNYYDKPCARHIAQRRPDGTYNYIHPDLRDDPAYHGMTPTNPTPLGLFGIQVFVHGGLFHGEQNDQSDATYADGRIRQWQGAQKFHFDYRPPAPASNRQPEQEEDEIVHGLKQIIGTLSQPSVDDEVASMVIEMVYELIEKREAELDS
jgi:hypothetical protein